MPVTTSKRRVKVGTVGMPLAPFPTVSAAFQTARLARADHFWLADHHRGVFPTQLWNRKYTSAARLTPNPDAYFEPTVTLARVAGRSRLTVGTTVTDAIRRNPADLARTWLTLHHATGGRAVLGIGAGERENTEPYGLPMDRCVSQLEETLRAVRAAWSSGGQPIDFDGDWTQWKQACFGLPGYRGTFPPIWVAAQGPRTLRIAGTLGDGWIGMQQDVGPEEWVELARTVARARRQAGRDLESFDVAAVIFTALAPDREALDEVLSHPVMRILPLIFGDSVWQRVGLEHPFGKGSLGFTDTGPEALTTEELIEVGSKTPVELLNAICYTGTAADVAKRLEVLVDGGARHVLLMDLSAVAGIGPAVRGQMETLRLMRRLRRMPAGVLAT